jgi:hypothetical protein
MASVAPQSLAAQARPGAVVGVVVNAQTREPVEGALVSLRFSVSSARTDSAGRFELPGIAPGPGLMQVRAIGYKVGSWAVRLAEGDTVRDTLPLEPVPVELSDITVNAARDNDWRSADGFERRRAQGDGYFVTEEQLKQQRPLTLVEVLRTVPGVSTQCDYHNCKVWMTRTARGCTPEYFLDGFPASFATGPTFPIEHIRGIEIYNDVFSAPIWLQRPNMQCGVIAIWTDMNR